MKTRHLALLLLLAAVASVALPGRGAEAPSQLALPGEGHLTSASIPEDGPALVAWESTETGWSQVALFEHGERTRGWTFGEALVKDARWLVPGETLRLGMVTEAGTETRVYELAADGGLKLRGSTAALAAEWDDVALSADGERWAAARFGSDAAEIAAGKLGDPRPDWQWELSASAAGAAKPGAVEELNRVELIAGTGGRQVVALLWNGRLSLADPGSPRRVAVEPPGDCDSVQTFTATADGLWVQCYRGRDASPSHLWGYYPATLPAGEKDLTAEALAAFRKPWFRPDGTVVDVDARLGKAEVFAVVAGRSEPVHLGRLELPVAGARYTPAGDVLLETTGQTEEYRVIPFGERIGALRASAGLADSPAPR